MGLHSRARPFGTAAKEGGDLSCSCKRSPLHRVAGDDIISPMGTSPRSREWTENRPSRGLRWPDLHELWQHRELVRSWKSRPQGPLQAGSIRSRVGGAPALAGVAVFTVVFRRFANVPSEGIPYPVFAFVGVATWTYFSGSVTRATQSLVNNGPGDQGLLPSLAGPHLGDPSGPRRSRGVLRWPGGAYGHLQGAPTSAIVTSPLWLLALMARPSGSAWCSGP